MALARFCVVGAGTAGSAAAVNLARRGHHVTILETVPKPSAVGAGIGLQPIGLNVLHKMDLLRRVLEQGSRIDRLWGTSHHNGKTVLDLSYRDLHPATFGIGLHRGVLFSELMGAVEACDIPVLTGRRVEGIVDEHGSLLDLRQRHSEVFVRTSDAEVVGPFDAVVAADGTRSALRQQFPGLQQHKPYPFGALWCVVPDPSRQFGDTLRQVYEDAGVMLGFLPSGSCESVHDGRPVLSIFWSVENSKVTKGGEADTIKAAVHKYLPEASPLVAGLSDGDVSHAEYADVVMSSLACPNAVILGDAAHATSPQLGQGANLALVDAWVLGECLGGRPSKEVAESLASYAARRRGRLLWHQFNSRLITPVFQSNSALIGSARDLLMPLCCRFPPTQYHMLAVMMGIKALNLYPAWKGASKAFLDPSEWQMHL